MKLLGITSVGVDVTDQLDFLNSSDTGEEMGVQWDSVSAVQTSRKPMIQSEVHVQYSH
jgi:hypothetical protein